MRPPMTPWLVLGAVIVMPHVIQAQAANRQPDTSAKAVIERAVRYLKDYKEAMQFVLADEKTSQDVFGNLGLQVGHRDTSGEFFLTYAATDRKWVGVRDIGMVDGVPIEKRDNLRELLNKGNVARIARQLIDHNARYNIGTVSRNMNDPMLALMILDDEHRRRFRFERRQVETTPAGTLVTIDFTERDEPTLVQGADGRYLHAKGQLVIDAMTGRFVRTFVILKDKLTTATLTTAFAENTKLGLWLPESMDERYDFSTGRTTELVLVKSTYTNYRKFNVNVVIK